jgi:exopolyphosphatase/guanosine-5'-triphosphate,3'-diphosphate pyrophosphatase
LAALDPERVQESDELYLLAPGERDNVKIRDDLLDVKRLERVDDAGLEQWVPVTKASFPVPAATVESVVRDLGVAVPALERATYTLDELLDEVVRPCADLLPVNVHKTRRRYTVGGCMAELTDVVAGRNATRTIAVESDDPELVLAAVRELGLSSRPNVSFPSGLAALVGSR